MLLYVSQFIARYWWLFILLLVASILELYVIPSAIAKLNNCHPPDYRRFSFVVACILLVTIIDFIINIPKSDPRQAHEFLNIEESTESTTDYNTYNSEAHPSDNGTVTQSNVDSLILSSEVRELTIDEIKSLSRNELALLRNAIFAMAGREYDDTSKYLATLQSYDWYNPYIPKDDFTWDYFNTYQFKNMNKIVEYEKSMGYR